MPERTGSMGRRAALVGAGGLALGVGAWLGWREYGNAGAVATEPVDAAFWASEFEQPTGGVLKMQALRGRPLLLNFWATWCPPCVEELPMLDAFRSRQAARGWEVVGLAIDQPSAVRSFLAKLPLRFPVGLAGLEGTELGKRLGNVSGGLPFTVVFGAGGAVRSRRMGRVTEADLQQWASST